MKKHLKGGLWFTLIAVSALLIGDTGLSLQAIDFTVLGDNHIFPPG